MPLIPLKNMFKANHSHSLDFVHLIKNWDQIVGKLLAGQTIPTKIKNNTLIIMTKHSVFSQELGLMSQEIINKIEQHLPSFKGKIKKLRFQHGRYSNQDFNTPVQITKAAIKKNQFDPALLRRRQFAKQISSELEDEELQDLFIRAFE